MLKVQVGNSAQCSVAAWMGVGFWREWIHVYIWLNGYMCIYGGLDCCVPETFATLLIGYTPESKSFLRSTSGIIIIAIFRIELHFYGMAIFIFASKRSVHSLPTIRSWGTIVSKELRYVDFRKFVIINGAHNKNISKLNRLFQVISGSKSESQNNLHSLLNSPAMGYIPCIRFSTGAVRFCTRRWELLGRYLKAEM